MKNDITREDIYFYLRKKRRRIPFLLGAHFGSRMQPPLGVTLEYYWLGMGYLLGFIWLPLFSLCVFLISVLESKSSSFNNWLNASAVHLLSVYAVAACGVSLAPAIFVYQKILRAARKIEDKLIQEIIEEERQRAKSGQESFFCDQEVNSYDLTLGQKFLIAILFWLGVMVIFYWGAVTGVFD